MSYPGPFPFTIPQGGTNKTSVPSFFAYLNSTASNVTGNNTTYIIVFDTEVYDTANGFNTGTGLYTVPVTGNYLFTSTVTVASYTASMTQTNASFKLNTGVEYFFNYNNPFATANSDQNIWNGSNIISLTAGQTVGVNVSVGNDTLTCDVIGGINITNFAGILLI